MRNILYENYCCPCCGRTMEYGCSTSFLEENISSTQYCSKCKKLFKVKFKIVLDKIEEIMED